MDSQWRSVGGIAMTSRSSSGLAAGTTRLAAAACSRTLRISRISEGLAARAPAPCWSQVPLSSTPVHVRCACAHKLDRKTWTGELTTPCSHALTAGGEWGAAAATAAAFAASACASSIATCLAMASILAFVARFFSPLSPRISGSASVMTLWSKRSSLGRGGESSQNFHDAYCGMRNSSSFAC
jgi:hypothetical protein